MQFKSLQLMMHRYWRWGVNEGRTSIGTTPTEYFGFNAFDVDKVHHYMVGDGPGTWFRLLDGRVFNMWAESCDPDPTLYDVTIN